MKKKIIALSLVIAMLAVAAISSTLAYFTDTEYNANVMTVGNVDITQDEIFDDTTVLQPGMQVEKEVTVTNVGQGDAYIRTLIAYEDTWDIGAKMKFNLYCNCSDNDAATNTGCTSFVIPSNKAETSPTNDWLQFKVTNDATGEWTVYTVAYFDYDNAGLEGSILPAGESINSLDNIVLNANTENDFYAKAGEKYDILVLTQAVQVGTFASAEEAFDAVYEGTGVINYDDDELVASWFAAQIGEGYTVEKFDYTSYNWDDEPQWVDAAGSVVPEA